MTPAATEPKRRPKNKTHVGAATAKDKRFDWPLGYEAENFILNQIQAFLARNRVASKLSDRMRSETGTL